MNQLRPTTLLDHAESAGAHLLEVLPRRPGPQERQLAAAGARCLERVVDVGQVVAEQRPPAAAVHEPQVLERRDMPEVPDERAHQRRMDALQVGVRELLHERQRALAGLGQTLDGLSLGEDCRRCRLATHSTHCPRSDMNAS